MRGGRLSGDGEDVPQAPHLVPTVPRRDVRRAANLGCSRAPLPLRPGCGAGILPAASLAGGTPAPPGFPKGGTPERPRHCVPTQERRDEQGELGFAVVGPRRDLVVRDRMGVPLWFPHVWQDSHFGGGSQADLRHGVRVISHGCAAAA